MIRLRNRRRFAASLPLLLSASLLWPAAVLGEDCASLATASWLVGKWEATAGPNTITESWNWLGPRSWEGEGRTTVTASGEERSSESLRLVEMSGAVFYIAKVGHNPLPVAFRLVECSPDRLVFSNPAHDFPRRIAYLKQPDGGLVAEVSDGGSRGFQLDFRRAGRD